MNGFYGTEYPVPKSRPETAARVAAILAAAGRLKSRDRLQASPAIIITIIFWRFFHLLYTYIRAVDRLNRETFQNRTRSEENIPERDTP